jgi:hypothetical protein
MPDPFWQHLLRQRSVARWGNFSWFSAKTLLMSINDQVAKSIESGQPGSIVDRRRMRWVAEQRDRGARCEVPIRLPDTKGMLLLGDTGEMDASQYVLVRDLSLVSAALRDEKGIDTALLMSDVVYPAGDINQWADAVYLPYFGLPAESWSEAWRGYAGTDSPPPAPLRGFNVLAMPGNHDWYDGLNGFMYHACGTEPLAEVNYDEAGLTRRQRLAKYSWRSPTPPERERVTTLRAEAARLSPRPPGPSREALEMTRGVVSYARSLESAAVPPADVPTQSMPNLPGPYYAVDVGKHPSHQVEVRTPNGRAFLEPAPMVRLVVVDTGITGTIDPEQADWLEQVLAAQPDEPPLPKVVVTGIPLLVRNKIHPFPVSVPADPFEPATDPPRTLQSILAGGDSVVATVAGDTHNYQRMVIHGATGETTSGVTTVTTGRTFPAGTPYPSVQIVAGGGGAYMSETHSIEYDGPTLVLRDDKGSLPEARVLGGGHTIFPGRGDSLLGFARRLRDGYLAILLGLALTGLASLALLIHVLDARWSQVHDQQVHLFGLDSGASFAWFVTGPWLAIVLAVVVVVIGKVVPKPAGGRNVWRTRAVIAVVLLVAAWVAFARDWRLAPLLLLLLGLAEVVLLALAHYLVPLLQSFPRLRRSLVVKLLALAVVVPVLLTNATSAVGLLLAGAVIVVGGFAVRGLFRHFRYTATKSMNRTLLWLLGVIPFVVVAIVTTLLTLVFPVQVLGAAYALDDRTAEALGSAVRMNSLGTLTLVCLGVLAVGFGMPLKATRRHLPDLGIGVAAVVGLVSLAASWWWGRDLGWSLVALVPAAGVLGLMLGLLAVLAVTGRRPVNQLAVEDALAARDGIASPEKDASLALAMTIGAIPGVDTLSEATKGDFHKNILTLETRALGDSTFLTFRAYGLDDESAPAAGPYALGANHGGGGFFPIDEVEITFTP